MNSHPIGIFDSGFGGLTVLREIEKLLPNHDFLYFGDNARAPYGNRSFEIIHKYTLEAVNWLFSNGCYLIVIACNTASAKALRTIQQKDLPFLAPNKRVLGIIRPVTEIIGTLTTTKHVGILGTQGTVTSNSYILETTKFSPEITVVQEACPLWVSLVENNEFESPGADYFIQKHIHNILHADSLIDTLVMGCTHYPLLMNKIRNHVPSHIKIVSQGEIVAQSLAAYLVRHEEINARCTKQGTREFYTSETAANFDKLATVFYNRQIVSTHVDFS